MTVQLYQGDCLEIMPTLDENSIDTIITDPPYGLEFMGKDWDKGVPGVAFWREALRVAKPGATLLAMGGTRTFHRLVCAIEDAGWEVKDAIGWVYGSGFPKSHNISKAIDKMKGAQREVVGRRKRDAGSKSEHAFERSRKLEFDVTAPATPEAQQWDGWGTALKPALELVCVAQKPREGTYVENALKWGVAGLNIDGGRVELTQYDKEEYIPNRVGYKDGIDHKIKGNNLGMMNYPYDGAQTFKPQGRFPANVIHDGSDEVMRGFPETGKSNGGGKKADKKYGEIYGYKSHYDVGDEGYYHDSGSAARFFYCAKASRSERNAGLEDLDEKFKEGANFRPNHTEKALDGDTGNPYGRWGKIQNNHPTVKPIALMQYLSRLTKTPTGGVVLDPFMGSGTTGIGAINEGRDFIGIEMNEEYFEIARRRIEYWKAQPRQLSLDKNESHKV